MRRVLVYKVRAQVILAGDLLRCVYENHDEIRTPSASLHYQDYSLGALLFPLYSTVADPWYSPSFQKNFQDKAGQKEGWGDGARGDEWGGESAQASKERMVTIHEAMRGFCDEVKMQGERC